MGWIVGLATMFVSILAVINMLGGVVSGIWLAVRGDWWAIGYGILGLIISPWVVSLLLVPHILLAAPSLALLKRGKIFLGRLLLGIGTFYMTLVMFFWSVLITEAFVTHPRQVSLFPILLWSYGVATGPWTYLASKDQQSAGNEFSMISVLFLQAGYIIGATLFLVDGTAPHRIVTPLAVALLLSWILQQTLAGRLLREEREHAV